MTNIFFLVINGGLGEGLGRGLWGGDVDGLTDAQSTPGQMSIQSHLRANTSPGGTHVPVCKTSSLLPPCPTLMDPMDSPGPAWIPQS